MRKESIRLKSGRQLITAAMDVLIVIAVVLTAGIVIGYFGTLAGSRIGTAYLNATNFLVLPIGFPEVRSLYGGVFDVNAVATVIICLCLEWVLSIWRARL